MESTILKICFSNLLRKNLRLGYPVIGYHEDLGVNDGFLLKLGVGSLQKYHFKRILLQYSSKLLRS